MSVNYGVSIRFQVQGGSGLLEHSSMLYFIHFRGALSVFPLILILYVTT